jgi:hypothetical protein
MSSAERSDELLLALASQHRDVLSVLRAFFSFLHRKTDFYVVDERDDRPVGFAPGAAEALVSRCRGTATDDTRRPQLSSHTLALPVQLLKAFRSFPYKEAAAGPRIKSSAEALSPKTSGARELPRTRVVEAPPESSRATIPRSPGAASSTVSERTRPTVSDGARTAAAANAPRLTEDGRQVPIANGGTGPGYWWSQSLGEVTAYIPLPSTTVSRDVTCRVTPSSLRVALRGAPAPLLEGPFAAAVRSSDSVWNMEGERGGGGGKLLTLSLEKAEPGWWTSLIRGHPEVAGELIDSSVPMSEYDEETQAAIRKLVWEQGAAQQAAAAEGLLRGQPPPVKSEEGERGDAAAAQSDGS